FWRPSFRLVLARFGLVLGHVGRQHIGADPLLLAYGDGIAPRYRDLLLIVPLEAVARRHDIGWRRQLQRFAGDDADLLVDIVDGLITDDGLRLTLDRDMTVGIEPIDFGITARTLGRAVMCGQGIGVDLGRPALSDSVPAGDVNLRVLLPFDARFSRNFDG